MKKVIVVLAICFAFLALSGVLQGIFAEVSHNQTFSEVLSLVVPAQAHADTVYEPDPEPPLPPVP